MWLGRHIHCVDPRNDEQIFQSVCVRLMFNSKTPQGEGGWVGPGTPPPGEGPGPEARVWEMPLEGLIFWESHPLRGAGPGGWRWTLPLPGGLKVKPLVCVGWAYDS